MNPIKIQKGSGPIILLIHGLNSHENFALSLMALARNYRIATWELPCHGSAPCRGQMTIEKYQDELLMALASSDETIDYVLGHSLGAAIALKAHQAKSVKGIILLSPLNPYLHENMEPELRKWLAPNDFISAKGALTKLVNAQARGDYFRNLDKAAQMFLDFATKHHSHLDYLINHQILSKQYQLGPLLALYQQAQAKLFFITGDQDFFTPLPSVKKIARALNKGVFVIKNCGHAPIFEYPKIVHTFIAKLIYNIS